VGSPTACSSGGLPPSWPSTSGTASSTSASADPRVEVHERTNARDLRPGDLGAPAELRSADVSFISLRTLLPTVLPLVAVPRDVVAQVTPPDLEAGR